MGPRPECIEATAIGTEDLQFQSFGRASHLPAARIDLELVFATRVGCLVEEHEEREVA